MNQLYFVPLGNALYWSTNIMEITEFASVWGLLGYVETGNKASFEIPNVICIHNFDKEFFGESPAG